MPKSLLILLCCFLCSGLTAQEYAEFSTDTVDLYRMHGGKSKLPESVLSQRWYVNGQEMRYGSGRIKVAVNPNQLDTIIYHGYRRKQADTIICNISEAKKYAFVHNPCCGAFNIREASSKAFISGSVQFRISGKDDQTYLGTLGEVGILVNANQNDTLVPACRSAMSPNVYPISFQQIEICKDSLNCTEGCCLQAEKGVNWEFSYHTISKKLDLLYLPLKSTPLIITYHPKTDDIEIR